MIRTVKPWSIRPIDPLEDDRLCEVCEDATATQTGITHQATRVDPAEWMDACDECAGVS